MSALRETSPKVIHRIVRQYSPGYTGKVLFSGSHKTDISANITKRGAAATDTLASDRTLFAPGDPAMPTIPPRHESEQEKPIRKDGAVDRDLIPIGEIAKGVVLDAEKKMRERA